MKKSTAAKIAQAAIIAALYAALTLAVSPIAYGPVQFRISELLTVLPLFSAAAIPGLTIGCAAANFAGVLLGLNYMPADILFGTLATLLASAATYFIGRYIKIKALKYILAPLPPVIFNALIIGAELTIFFDDLFWLNTAWVGFGELAVCYILGIPLIFALLKNNIYKKIFK